MLQSIVESLELNVEYSLNGAMSSQNVKGNSFSKSCIFNETIRCCKEVVIFQILL